MKTPDFAIFQHDRHKQTAVWVREKGEWTNLPNADFEVIQDLAKYIRVAPDPMEVVDELRQQAIAHNKKEINYDNEPGFFIPPEELDGLDGPEYPEYPE